MLEPGLHLLIPVLLAVMLAIVMGGSGTGPSFSVAYGAGIIKRSTIPLLFGLMVFLGAAIAGKATGQTLGKEILPAEMMNYKVVTIILFSVFLALLIANLTGIPQSTSQATVFSVTAVSIYYGVFNSNKLFFEIIPTWFILPVFSFLLCFLIGRFLYKPLRKTGISYAKKFNKSHWLKGAILILALYVAFSIGSNNVANAVGPLTSMLYNENGMQQSYDKDKIMLATVFLTAPFFGLGSVLFGKKILHNTGKEIVLLGKFEALIIAFVSGSLLLLASLYKGIPTSLVQLNVGAILGIGVSKMGFACIFKKTQVNRFFIIWILAPLIAFVCTLLLLLFFDYIGL